MANLQQALAQLQQERTRLKSQLEKINIAVSALTEVGKKSRTRGTMSAAARIRIAAAQKARWAKWRKAHKRH
jgi:hypothetical protein